MYYNFHQPNESRSNDLQNVSIAKEKLSSVGDRSERRSRIPRSEKQKYIVIAAQVVIAPFVITLKGSAKLSKVSG